MLELLELMELPELPQLLELRTTLQFQLEIKRGCRRGAEFLQ